MIDDLHDYQKAEHVRLIKVWNKNRIKASKDSSFAEAEAKALKELRMFEHSLKSQGVDIGHYYP